MKRGVVILALMAMAVAAQSADAQHRRHGKAKRGPGGSFSVSLVGADAVGDLGTVVDKGFGLQLGGALPMAADGHLRIRGDLGFVVYGIERLYYCGFSCRVSSELTTTNNILFAGIGPELVLSDGDVQPYVYGTAGVSYFVTSSSLDDHDGYGPYLQTTNYSDAVYGLKYGGGIRFRMGGRNKPIFLDLGVERHDNGIANYLTRGDIVDNPDGTVTLYPNRSDADLTSFRLGVTIGG
ncbi:MAG: hypothetical protein R3253_12490 [Longimicrobiales bacterium]|nr:hypothetical protein [Longimicrobiales bacterium]